MGVAGQVLSQGTLRWGAAVSTFVSVGNATHSFDRLLDAVAALAHTLPQPVVVQHGATRFDSACCIAHDFVDMPTFEKLASEAELLILHAGAGSVIHAIKAGKVPVVMPRLAAFNEHVNDHQLEFAQELERLGKVVMARTAEDLQLSTKAALRRQKSRADSVTQPALLQMIESALQRYEQSLPRGGRNAG